MIAYESEFDDQLVRSSFIRKVYSLLFIQLLITFGIVSIFVFLEDAKLWAMQHRFAIFIGLGMQFVLIILMGCFESLRRTVPINFILFFVYTLIQGFVLGVLCAFIDPYIILLTVGITALNCFMLILFAFQTKVDFTGLGGILFVISIVLIIFGIIVIFFPSKAMVLLYATAGTILISIYLIVDTQLMMGGAHKYSISPEEYIFATLNVYTDIVQLFLFMLTILLELDLD